MTSRNKPLPLFSPTLPSFRAEQPHSGAWWSRFSAGCSPRNGPAIGVRFRAYRLLGPTLTATSAGFWYKKRIGRPPGAIFRSAPALRQPMKKQRGDGPGCGRTDPERSAAGPPARALRARRPSRRRPGTPAPSASRNPPPHEPNLLRLFPSAHEFHSPSRAVPPLARDSGFGPRRCSR